MKTLLTIPLVILLMAFLSCTSSYKRDESIRSDNEEIYLKRIREDFIKHKEDLTNILTINRSIVARIDSLLNGLIKQPGNTNLAKGIMNTRAYDLSIVAYKDILNGDYINDADLKLEIATHVAKFEGFAESKRSWDYQWDVTARPYLYANGLLSSGDKRNNLISDPAFRSLLLDRRMFAYDVERVTPRIMPSADSVITAIEELLRK